MFITGRPRYNTLQHTTPHHTNHTPHQPAPASQVPDWSMSSLAIHSMFYYAPPHQPSTLYHAPSIILSSSSLRPLFLSLSFTLSSTPALTPPRHPESADSSTTSSRTPSPFVDSRIQVFARAPPAAFFNLVRLVVSAALLGTLPCVLWPVCSRPPPTTRQPPRGLQHYSLYLFEALLGLR